MDAETRVLIVAAEPALLRSMTEAARLVAHGIEAAPFQGAMEKMDAAWDVVVLEPPSSGAGLRLLEAVRASDRSTRLILVTGRVSIGEVLAAFRLGAFDVLLKPLLLRDLCRSIERALAKGRAMGHEIAPKASANAPRADATIHDEAHRTTVRALLAALELRLPGALAHALRVEACAAHLAAMARYPDSLLGHLRHAALLHDIGKLGVAEALFAKRGPLTGEEQRRFREHAALGEALMHRIPFLRTASQIVRHHHEQWDGTGYPDRLAGDRIPLGSRIVSLADALDALAEERPWRPAFAIDRALQEIAENAGTQFDPFLVQLLCAPGHAVWARIRTSATPAESEPPTVAGPPVRHPWRESNGSPLPARGGHGIG